MRYSINPAPRRVARAAHLRRANTASPVTHAADPRHPPAAAPCALSAGTVAYQAKTAVAGVVVRIRHTSASSAAAWWVTVRTAEYRLLDVCVSEEGCCVAVESPWQREESEGL